MDAGRVGLVVSFIALAVSGVAAWYARQQAKASHAQAAEAKRAADIAEQAARSARSADLETRLSESVNLNFTALDGLKFEATVKSTYTELLSSISLEVLPRSERPLAGFTVEAEYPIADSWEIEQIAPGQFVTRVLIDLREDDFSPLDVRLSATVGETAVSWIKHVKLPYTPTIHF